MKDFQRENTSRDEVINSLMDQFTARLIDWIFYLLKRHPFSAINIAVYFCVLLKLQWLGDKADDISIRFRGRYIGRFPAIFLD